VGVWDLAGFAVGIATSVFPPIGCMVGEWWARQRQGPSERGSAMAETGAILAWTLVSECPVPTDGHEVLVEGEIPIVA